MKHKLLVLQISILAILFSVQHVMAQQKKSKYYKIKTELMNGKLLKGYLYKVNNQSVYILTDRTSMHIDSIKGEEIKRIAIRREGKVGRSMGIAAASGGVSMFIFSAAMYAPCEGLGCIGGSAAEEATVGAIVGAIAGVIVGGIVGIFNNSSERINGNLATYLRYVPKIKKYVLQP